MGQGDTAVTTEKETNMFLALLDILGSAVVFIALFVVVKLFFAAVRNTQPASAVTSTVVVPSMHGLSKAVAIVKLICFCAVTIAVFKWILQ